MRGRGEEEEGGERLRGGKGKANYLTYRKHHFTTSYGTSTTSCQHTENNMQVFLSSHTLQV